uniref:Uncharacterized protein n=1 Tax=virus sp. ctBM815 TaxID=2825806 RepID=A0A8S5RJF8_9VIRU|nr:MAG TPA: hypothetical protein [virus sp. ctBM815]DAG45387.1 MAG TPA: hypothetical protein [Caudoviricetes sp.]DAH14069.1 MAG TPA: hypothetical protein [Caudoviricetes sp.]DAJ58788.1 MAG TPA: hypothetical protein [Caudoviricetes sp.]
MCYTTLQILRYLSSSTICLVVCKRLFVFICHNILLIYH